MAGSLAGNDEHPYRIHKDDKLQGYSNEMGRNTNAEKGLGKSQSKA